MPETARSANFQEFEDSYTSSYSGGFIQSSSRGGGDTGYSTASTGASYDYDDFDREDSLESRERYNSVRQTHTSEDIVRTPEVEKALVALGMDPDEEFDDEDIRAQFRIKKELEGEDPKTLRRLNIARDFLIGKLLDL
eukprot:CAMPEP_0167747592 /NCGR_PEP_ID=MMETSP0110_2-20121227/4369_1 /TAXON_ID=629695 /ORGANISM="Gymnochlora sp., Strain CCMP2014" /LENGTH=137 /DNA_ID=CAMNT_0007632515 /DNA_START=280 /DNA_END=693 /DNA_ORIENTATION=+